ncbi:MAG: rubredoxin [Candidatus Hodarchaeales archaeon]|jgi:rubredoxin
MTSKDWWRCTVCGYIYKPEIGDAVSKISSGTPFIELPEDWVCPVCFADKKVFFSFEKSKAK